MEFKQVIKVRSIKYEKFHNVDYKIITLPSNLYDLTISIKFVKWFGFLPLCPTNVSITSILQYGTFPLFKYDSRFQQKINNMEKIEMLSIHPNDDKQLMMFNLRSPKSGQWYFGSIFDNNDDFEHFIICSANLIVEMKGLVTPPSMAVLLSGSPQSVNIPLSVNDSHSTLLELMAHEPLSRLKIELLCSSCLLIISTAFNSIPTFLTIADAKQRHHLYRSGDVIVDVARPEVSTRLLLQLRSLPRSVTSATLIVSNIRVTDDKNVTFLPPAAIIKADSLFAFRFSSPRDESTTISSTIRNHVIMIQPFFVEPIKDQGAILTIDLLMSRSINNSSAKESVYLYIGDNGVSTRKELQSSILSGSHSIVPNTSTSLSFYYPRWGWWYISAMVDSSDAETAWKVEMSITSRRCKTGCNNNGICLLSAIDNGLVSTCHCLNNYLGLDCLGKRKPSLSLTQHSISKKNWLVLSNLAFIPAIIVATMQRIYILSIVYTATAGFSMVYHGCSIQDNNIKSCIMPVEQLVFYDHFAAVFCLWTTLVSLTTLSSKVQSILIVSMIFVIMVMAHMVQKSVFMYTIPVIVGLLTIIVCWSYRMHQLKCIFPPIDWWIFGFVPGIGMTVAGFVSFRLSIHEEYLYYLYHSAWHILISLSICFILPNTSRWEKALNKRSSTHLIGADLNAGNKKWRKFKKRINYYLHLDILTDYLVLHHPRCSILKSY